MRKTLFLFALLSAFAFAQDSEKPADTEVQHDGSQFCGFYAEPLKTVDGDTLDVRPLNISFCADSGKNITDNADDPVALEPQLRIRLLALDTPEYRENGFKEAGLFTKRWLKSQGRVLVMHSADVNGLPTYDRYGRLVAIVAPVFDGTVPLKDIVSQSLNVQLLDEFHAEPLMLYSNRTMAILNGLVFRVSRRAADEKDNPGWLPTYIRY